MTLQSLSVNGLHLDRAPGPGRPLLFVHGSHAGAWCWANFLPFFAARGHDAYALSLRGHAPNPPLDELGQVSLTDYADDVLAAMERLGGDPILVGHSLGAAVCQLAAARRPPAALVLASAAPLAGVKFRRPPLGLQGAALVLRALPRLLAGQALLPDPHLNLEVVLAKVPPAQRQALFDRLGPESTTALLEIARGRHRADLAAAPFPRLVISGDADAVLVLAMQRDLARQLEADLIELPGHGHAFMLEPGWERCAALLADWLDRQLLGEAPPAGALPA